MDTLTFCEGVQQRLKATGFEVHNGDSDDGDLAGRWWWTLSRDGWSAVEAQPDESANECEAWLSALACALAEAEISMDALLVQRGPQLSELASRSLPEDATR